MPAVPPKFFRPTAGSPHWGPLTGPPPAEPTPGAVSVGGSEAVFTGVRPGRFQPETPRLWGRPAGYSSSSQPLTVVYN